MKCRLLLGALVAWAVVFGSGCGERNHDATDRATPEPAAPRVAEGKLDAVAARWRAERNPKDLLWLAERIPKGTNADRVKQLLGEPLGAGKLVNGGEIWLYVRIDPGKQQFEALSLLFDRQMRYVGLGTKPVE